MKRRDFLKSGVSLRSRLVNEDWNVQQGRNNCPFGSWVLTSLRFPGQHRENRKL